MAKSEAIWTGLDYHPPTNACPEARKSLVPFNWCLRLETWTLSYQLALHFNSLIYDAHMAERLNIGLPGLTIGPMEAAPWTWNWWEFDLQLGTGIVLATRRMTIYYCETYFSLTIATWWPSVSGRAKFAPVSFFSKILRWHFAHQGFGHGFSGRSEFSKVPLWIHCTNSSFCEHSQAPTIFP